MLFFSFFFFFFSVFEPQGFATFRPQSHSSEILALGEGRVCVQSLETSQRQIKQLQGDDFRFCQMTDSHKDSSDCQGRESLMSQSHSHCCLFYFLFLFDSLGRVNGIVRHLGKYVDSFSCRNFCYEIWSCSLTRSEINKTWPKHLVFFVCFFFWKLQ